MKKHIKNNFNYGFICLCFSGLRRYASTNANA